MGDDLRILLASRKGFYDTTAVDLEILDVLTNCFFDREQFVAAFTNRQPEAEVNPAEKDAFAANFGKRGADARWAPYSELMADACEHADQKWRGGDEAWHTEMVDYLLGRTEFKSLCDNRRALLRAVGQVAEKFGRKKGTKKQKI